MVWLISYVSGKRTENVILTGKLCRIAFSILYKVLFLVFYY